MGCDIHLQVERRVNGKWERVERLPPRPCSWCDGAGHHKDRPNDKCYWCGERAQRETGAATPGVDVLPFHDRNYTVFSVLANVRSDGYVTPISEPRGLPEDANHATGTDEEGQPRANGEYGDHSFSWLTVDEVLAYEWKKECRDEGWVDAKVFAAWDAKGGKGTPESWSGGVSGRMVEHVTHSRMREYIADGMKEHPLIAQVAGGERSYYTLVQWTFTLADYCNHFLSFVDSLAPLGEPKDIRLVFGFDS